MAGLKEFLLQAVDPGGVETKLQETQSAFWSSEAQFGYL